MHSAIDFLRLSEMFLEYANVTKESLIRLLPIDWLVLSCCVHNRDARFGSDSKHQHIIIVSCKKAFESAIP